MSNLLHMPFDIDFIGSSGRPAHVAPTARYVAAAPTALGPGQVSPDRKAVAALPSVSYGGENILELKG
jgi:hypothetical protein